MKQRRYKAKNWDQVSPNDVYKASIDEFRGMTIQALQDIREDIKEIKKDMSINRYIHITIGGIGGVIISVLTAIGMKH